MPKVDWITWKTEGNDLINPTKVVEKIEDQFQTYHTYMNSVIAEGIKQEMFYGGLDTLSLNIMGTSPAHEKAKEILEEIEAIQREYDSLKKKIIKDSTIQKQLEKEQLMEALGSKILEEEKILNNTLLLRDKMNQNGNIKNVQQLRLDDIIDDTNNRINKLKERLDAIRSI